MHGAASRQLSEIAQAARSVSGTLDEIVWTVSPRNDTLDGLVGYLGEFATEYLAPTGLHLQLALPVETPAYVMSSDIRHQVFLAVKETLNNAVKHSKAKTVKLFVNTDPAELRIVIADDGCGFEAESVAKFSNGLINLRQRLEALGGSAQIESRPGAGTTVILCVPLSET